MRHLLIFTVRNSSFYRCLSVQEEGGGYPGRKGACGGVICPEGVSIPQGLGLSPATLVFHRCLSVHEGVGIPEWVSQGGWVFKGWVYRDGGEYLREVSMSRDGYVQGGEYIPEVGEYVQVVGIHPLPPPGHGTWDTHPCFWCQQTRRVFKWVVHILLECFLV